MLPMNTIIRRAKIRDAAGIARVHVESWQAAYKGIIAAEFLDKLSITQKTKERELWLMRPPPGNVVLVAEVEGEIVGFASCGRERTEHSLYTGELYALYLLPSHQGGGIGRKLVEATARVLLAQGHQAMLIWVLTENEARGFYERLGGRMVLKKNITIGQQVLPEVGYDWDDMLKDCLVYTGSKSMRAVTGTITSLGKINRASNGMSLGTTTICLIGWMCRWERKTVLQNFFGRR